MHILFVTGEYPPMQGGVGAYTRALALALRDYKVRISVLTSQRAAQPDCAKFDSCISVFPAIEKWDWRIFEVVPELAHELGVDCVHVQYQTAAFGMHPAINFAPAWWKRKGVRTGWTYHDLLPMYLFPKAGRLLRRWVTERPAHSAECVITTNEADRMALASRQIDAVTIPIGSNIVSARLSSEQRQARRQRRGFADSDMVLGFFGFLNQSKGGDDLIETMRRLHQTRTDVHLLMIGDKVGASDPTTQAYVRKVEGMIRKHRLQDKVHWTGAEPDNEVAADLNACDVVLLPFADGASLRRGTLMAALANGCAIITTTPQAPLPELRHERDLLYVDASDSQAMAAAILRLTTDNTLRTTLQTNARRAARQFGWEEIARRHLERYAKR
jgi:glycosyltransferase involved in cell wall biosynthesis